MAQTAQELGVCPHEQHLNQGSPNEDELELDRPLTPFDNDQDSDWDSDDFEGEESQVVPSDHLPGELTYYTGEYILDTLDTDDEGDDWLDTWTPPTKIRMCRNHFLSSYKVNKMGWTTRPDLKLIAQSKYASYWADCKLDATLYTQPGWDGDGRWDERVYISLYGLEPGTVERIDYGPAIMLLDQYATVKASDDVPSNRFYARFVTFLNVFEDSHFEPGYLDIESSPVNKAHMEFLHVLDEEL